VHSEAGVEAATRSEAGGEAVVHSEAGVEAATRSEVGGDAAACFGAGIKDDRQWQHDSV
jgi:hypothetical protein